MRIRNTLTLITGFFISSIGYGMEGWGDSFDNTSPDLNSISNFNEYMSSVRKAKKVMRKNHF